MHSLGHRPKNLIESKTSAESAIHAGIGNYIIER
jgi:hypothetical protein